MDKRLFAEARQAQQAFILTVSLSFIQGIIVIGQAYVLSLIINGVFLAGESFNDVSGNLVLLFVLISARVLVHYGSVFSASQIAIHVKSDLRGRLIDHLVALGPTYLHGERSGELITTATEGIEQLDAWFRDYLPGLFTALLVPLSILFVVLPIDILTFFVLFFTAPLIPLFMALIGMAAGRLAKRQFDEMSRMSAHFLDVMQGLSTLKLFNRSRRQIEIIRRITDDFRTSTMNVLRVAFLSAFMLEFLATISVAIVAVEIGLRLLYGRIDFQPALFLLIIAPEYYLPLRSLGAKFHAGKDGTAAADRIFTVLETPLPEQSPTHNAIPTAMNITFENVEFAYDNGERPALNGISFTIQAGERVAIVGASGSGKTTIANLLLRFIEPQAGRILVDGVDLRTLPVDTWRMQIGWVPQQPYLFNTTITNNITLGMGDATQNQIEAAAIAAEAYMFITNLKDSYETQCGERGTSLSGGQAQRIALARAFLKDAPFLLLDEATANLDPSTEQLIEASITRLIAGKTALIIAHRLNTVFQADRIIVLESGRVVEQGTHDELLAANSHYARFVHTYTEVSYEQ